jgi:outer membrane protein TolC
MNAQINQAARWSLLACLAIVAAACTVGPSYKTPTTDIPAAFKEQPPAGVSPGDWKPANPQDAIQRGKWWEIFGDPSLNALEEQVSVSNQTLAQSEAQFRGARAAVREARAGLFPTVTAGASVTK